MSYPQEIFLHHNLQVIYTDKVAQIFDDGNTIMIIHNPPLATTARKIFDFVWSTLPELPELPELKEKRGYDQGQITSCVDAGCG